MVFHNSLEFYIGGLYCISVRKIANNFTIAVSTIPPKLVFCYKEKKVVFLASFLFPKKKTMFCIVVNLLLTQLFWKFLHFINHIERICKGMSFSSIIVDM